MPRGKHWIGQSTAIAWDPQAVALLAEWVRQRAAGNLVRIRSLPPNEPGGAAGYVISVPNAVEVRITREAWFGVWSRGWRSAEIRAFTSDLRVLLEQGPNAAAIGDALGEASDAPVHPLPIVGASVWVFDDEESAHD